MSSTINNFKIAYESVWLRDFLQDVMNRNMKYVFVSLNKMVKSFPILLFK